MSLKPYFTPHLKEPSLWQIVNRKVPRLGTNRDLFVEQTNKKYGPGTWRFAWEVDGKTLNFEDTCKKHYEESYFKFLNERRDIAQYLSQKAVDVYDTNFSNINSKEDYLAQEDDSTHIQDIAIRRAMARLNIPFKGDELIQVRGKSIDPIGRKLSPFKVPFHRPDLVESKKAKPSVEDFWQANRVIEFCDKLAKIQPFNRVDYIYGMKKIE